MTTLRDQLDEITANARSLASMDRAQPIRSRGTLVYS